MTPPYPSPEAPVPDYTRVHELHQQANLELGGLVSDAYGWVEAAHTNAKTAIGATIGKAQKYVRDLHKAAIRDLKKVQKRINDRQAVIESNAVAAESFASQTLPPIGGGDCLDRWGQPIHVVCPYPNNMYTCCIDAGYSEEECKCYGDEPPPPPPPPDDCVILCGPDGKRFGVCVKEGEQICVDPNTGKEIECPPGPWQKCDDKPPPPPPKDKGCPECCPPSPIVIQNTVKCEPIVKVVPCPPEEDEDEEEEEEELCIPGVDFACTTVSCAPPPVGAQIGYTTILPFKTVPGEPDYYLSDCGILTMQSYLARFHSVGALIGLWQGLFPGKAALSRIRR